MRRVEAHKRKKCAGKRASAPKIPPTISLGVSTAPAGLSGLSGLRPDKEEIRLFTFSGHRKTPVLCKDFREWAAFMCPHGKILAEHKVANVTFAIVFTGYSYEMPPKLFEFVVYGGDDDGRRILFTQFSDAKAYMNRAIRQAKYKREKANYGGSK